MTKKLKVIQTVCLLSIVALLVLSGCSSSGAPKEEKPSSAQSSATASGSPASTPELEPYEIVFAYPGNQPKDLAEVQAAISAVTQQKINATVKLMPISFSAWAQQTNLMLAGNEKVDVMFTGSDFSYSTLVSKNQLLPLNDLLDQYGTGIKDQLSPEILATSMVKGEVYAVPSIRDFAAEYGITMRKDIIDKYGIDISAIKAPSDLTAVFKAVKDNEPYMTPLVLSGQTNTFVETLLGGQFDTLSDKLGVLPLSGNTDKIVNFYETQEYADMLNLVREWYMAGYISKDAATSKELGSDLVKAQRAFSYMDGMKPGYEQQSSRLTATEMVVARLTPSITTTNRIANVMMSIPRNTEDAERSMMFLNLMYTDPELVNLFDNGIEGKHYVKASDNLIQFPSGVDSSTSGYPSINYMIGNNFLSYVWIGDDPEIWTKMQAFNDSSTKSQALGITFDLESVKTEVAAVNNVKAQFRMGLETGTFDPAQMLPDFIAKLKGAGIDKIIAEKQKQYDEWKATKS
ncbi:ABC transporter substrate-binding protein [Paenibacillaceae bacterium WGS1546]|uniref:ABC transporter substrate-binding protein n=1 Tax=Cohnella sp. WGS1546 TaxID=3366810 RepID=UPI00372CE796